MSTTPIRLSDAAADLVRTLARQLAAASDTSVTQSTAVAAAAAYALDHVAEVAEPLRRRADHAKHRAREGERA